MKRAKYPTEWNLDLLFKDNPTNVKKERAKIKKAYLSFAKRWKNRKDYLEKPSALKKVLEELENLSTNHAPDELHYLSLKSSKESTNSVIQARLNQAIAFYTPIFNEIEFFNVNLSKIPKNKQEIFLKDERLKEFKHLLEKEFAAGKHTLTESEEKILNLKSPVSHSNWTKMTSSFISKEEVEIINEKGKKEFKTFSEITRFFKSRNKKTRESAKRGFSSVTEKYSDVAENEFNSVLQNKRINDDLRGYKRPDSARHLVDDMDSKAVDTLVSKVTKSLKISRDFYSFRKKLSGIKKTEYYDRFVDISTKKQKKYNYEQSVILLKKVFSKLDSEFDKIFVEMVKKGQIDVWPKKGKRGGAYCSYGAKKQPVYVFLNHDNTLSGTKTLAHEMGHAINGVYIKKNQNSLNSDDSLATAEIASTFMEDFVIEELYKKADDEERLTLMIKSLDETVASVFRQIAGYNFEKEIHLIVRQKGYVSKEEIGSVFKKHMASYLGKSFGQGTGIETGWVHWSHFRSFFYVYTYASGLLISKYLQKKVRENPEFIKKIKVFLSTGGSKSPKQILKELGVDITKAAFWDTGLKEIEKDLNRAKKLAKKLGKI